jgi:hypothetical protein
MIQITSTIALALMLGRIPQEASGCSLNGGMKGSPRPSGTILRLVTYADMHSNDALSIGVRPTAGFVAPLHHTNQPICQGNVVFLSHHTSVLARATQTDKDVAQLSPQS